MNCPAIQGECERLWRLLPRSLWGIVICFYPRLAFRAICAPELLLTPRLIPAFRSLASRAAAPCARFHALSSSIAAFSCDTGGWGRRVGFWAFALAGGGCLLGFHRIYGPRSCVGSAAFHACIMARFRSAPALVKITFPRMMIRSTTIRPPHFSHFAAHGSGAGSGRFV